MSENLPMVNPLSILLFEDNADDIELTLRTLRSAGFQVQAHVTTTPEQFLAGIHLHSYDVILSDYRMPGITGLDVYELMRAQGVDIPFILVTGSLGDENAVECLKRGISDYVLKDHLARLPMSVCRSLSERHLREERARAEAALRRSEVTYRSLVERSPYGIFRARLDDGGFLEANRALVEMLGYQSGEEVLKLDPRKQVYADGEAGFQGVVQHASHGRAWSGEVAWRRKDGAVITVELTGGPVVQEEHGSYLELIASDISARKRATERIQQLNRLYSVSTHVSQAIVRTRNAAALLRELCRIIVEEGRFRRAFVAAMDAGTSQIIPLACWGAEDPQAGGIPAASEVASRHRDAWAAIRRGEHYLCRNGEAGSISSVAVGAFPLKLKGRSVGGIILSAEEPGYFDEEGIVLLDELVADVSFALENLDLAQQRQQAVDELNQFFSLSRDILCIADTSGRAHRSNRASEKILGFSPGEVGAAPLIDMVCPGDRRRALEALEKLQSGAEVNSLELRILAKDGSYKWLVCNATPVAERGLVFAAMHDITERKNLEEQLRRQNIALEAQNRRVQTANSMKSEFLANMSHELRSPLNGIIGFAELLVDGRIGPLSAPQRDLLGRMLNSSKHLLRLINDVLDFSKVDAGRLELRPERVVLRCLVQEVTGILAALATEKRIQVDMEINPEIDEVMIDPARFKQVLYNYLSNALKFTGEQGHVVVSVRTEGPKAFRLEVSDNGPGISARDVDRLFTDFEQLDSGPSKRHQGTGLGLALTRRLVEAQGGTVGVRSEPGTGSVFYAVLPLSIHSDQPAPPRILVVEDEPVELAVVSHILKKAGFVVETASTGRAALSKVRSRSFDAITLDLMLPDISGWDVLAAIRAAPKNRAVPILILSIVQEADVAGADRDIQGFLTKPVCREALLDAMSRAGLRPPVEEEIHA